MRLGVRLCRFGACARNSAETKTLARRWHTHSVMLMTVATVAY